MFGSPMAHKGAAWLGAVFKGEKEILKPDFLEAGQRILSGLELGSSYTWDLAERDLLAAPLYDATPETPFPFVFHRKLKDYGPLKRLLAGAPGSDGTVRWAGTGLNTRKIEVDLTQESGVEQEPRVIVSPRALLNIPLVLLPEVNHSTIVREPPKDLVQLVKTALEVETNDEYTKWVAAHSVHEDDRAVALGAHQWQQFVVRAVDERGDPIPDFYLEIGASDDSGVFAPLPGLSLDAHTFTDDHSYRCFHVNLSELKPEDPRR